MKIIHSIRHWIVFFFMLVLIVPVTAAEPERIALYFKNADIKDVLRALAEQAGVNLIVDNQINSPVTIHISQVTFMDALNILCKNNGLTYTHENNVYHLLKVDNSILNVVVNTGTISIEAKDASLKELLDQISRKTGRNYILASDVNERITILLKEVTFDDALLAILAQTNCMEEPLGNVIRISKKATDVSGRNGNFRIQSKNGLVSINAENADAVSLFNELSRQTGTNISVARDLRGTITIHLNNIALDPALMAITTSQGWNFEKQPTYYFISNNNSANQNTRITYNPDNQLFDLDIPTASLASVLYQMAQKANLNLVILSQVNLNVSNTRIRGQSFEAVLDLLFKGTLYTFIKNNNTYLIADGIVVRPEISDFAVVKIYPIKYLKADLLLSTLPATFAKQNFTVLQDKNSMIVSGNQSLQDKFSSYLSQVDIESVEDRTEMIKIKYLKAEDVLKYLPQSISKSDIVVIKEQNALAITGPYNLINQVRQYVDKIDQVNPMIVFDILVVQISNQEDFDWSISGTINHNKIGIDPTTGKIKLNTTTAQDLATITALISKGKAKVLANPTISTLNGYQASFSVSTKQNYNIQTETVINGDDSKTVESSVKTYDSGLYFTILPWVSANNQITMDIKPKYSEFGAAAQGSDLPSTFERATETTIRVNNQQTVIISGLKRSTGSTSSAKIPFLGDLPILGKLFQADSKLETQDEFVIVITPYLIYDIPDQTETNQNMINHFGEDLKKGIQDGLNQNQPRGNDSQNPVVK